MKPKFLAGASVAALVLAGMAQAVAQTAPPADNTTPPAKIEVTPPKVEMKTAPAAGKTQAQQGADDWRTSKVVGLNVYNVKNEKIGDINDLILSPDGKALHAIVGVGGFLGINEKNVAVPFGDLKLTRKDDGSIHAMFDSTKESLQSAPNYVFYQPARG